MTEWRRVSKGYPCPACNKPDWCSVTADGAVVCCMRIESPKQLRNGGWLHRLSDGNGWDGRRIRRIELRERKRTPACDFRELSARYERAADDVRVSRLAAQLRVSADSLRRLHVGYDGQAWTFPMRDVTRRIIGVRRRFPNGGKCCVNGSQTGLFVPTDVADTGQLLICEGATDTAALLTLGFPAIGRPSCTGGTTYVVQLARGRDVVVVADADAPGQRGAIRLATSLRPHCPSVRIIVPPRGVKDARAWVQAGATRGDIESTLNNGPIVRFAEPTRRAVGVSYRETG